jgi:hypothetical protein
MFLKYQRIMTPDKLLYNSIIIIVIFGIIDYIIIDNHPYLLENFDDDKDDKEDKYEKYNKDDDDFDLDSIIDTINSSNKNDDDDDDDDDYVYSDNYINKHNN